MVARKWVSGMLALVVLCLAVGASPAARRARAHREAGQSEGSLLFDREWPPGIRHGEGDGLGPVYNARSCVACHHQGGSGGAGPVDRNVLTVTPISSSFRDPEARRRASALVREKTGLLSSGSAVVHRSGTAPGYAAWRKRLLTTKFDGFSLRRAERNTPALFGAGPIDAISDAALVAAAADRVDAEFPEVRGRVSRLADGRLGRFGWKGHTARLGDFVLTACSVELGLEVAGHHQAADPTAPGASTRGLDLDADECAALVAYVRDLPAPRSVPTETPAVELGAVLFRFVGCASCHLSRLGAVEGLYSDLLLHDLGPGLSDSVAYYETELVDPPQTLAGAAPAREPMTVVAAGPLPEEWRTPPLWGVGDSGPYLHDGRARTLYAAIRHHGGEAAPTVRRFRELAVEEQQQVLLFLLSLQAPGPAPRPRIDPARYEEERRAAVLGARSANHAVSALGPLAPGRESPLRTMGCCFY